MDEHGHPLLVFDGDCGFCTASAEWVASGWDGRATAVAWQQLGAARLQQLGLSLDQVRAAAWWVEPSGRVYGGPRAIGQALRAGVGWRHLLGRLILTPLAAPVAAVAYRIIARYRHRLPGGSATCRPSDHPE